MYHILLEFGFICGLTAIILFTFIITKDVKITKDLPKNIGRIGFPTSNKIIRTGKHYYIIND